MDLDPFRPLKEDFVIKLYGILFLLLLVTFLEITSVYKGNNWKMIMIIEISNSCHVLYLHIHPYMSYIYKYIPIYPISTDTSLYVLYLQIHPYISYIYRYIPICPGFVLDTPNEVDVEMTTPPQTATEPPSDDKTEIHRM